MAKRSNGRLRVKPLGASMGAEITGVDLSQALDNDNADIIEDAFRDHVAIFFPGQTIDPGQMTAFVSRFGGPLEHPYLKPIPGHPFVHELRKTPGETVNFGNVWHTDFTNLERPSLANALYARTLPAFGGDTLFINMYAAFEALSPGLQERLARMNAVHAFTEKYKQDLIDQNDRAGVTKDDLQRADDRLVLDKEVLHPAVRQHPKSGRRALYVNPGFTLRFDGLSEAESAPMLEFLYRHAARPEFGYRHCWRENMLGIWDNRYSMHYALNDYAGQLRVMHRMVVLEAEKPALAGNSYTQPLSR